jgi:hypothetical protein
MLPYEEILDESGQLVADRVVNVHRHGCPGGGFNSQVGRRRPYPRVRACKGCGNWFDSVDAVIVTPNV